MTDEQQTEAPAKRPPGRPRARKSRAERQTTHHGRSARSGGDDDDVLQNFEYRPYEQDNPLAIDPDIVRSIQNEWGYSLLWVMYEVHGAPFPDRVNARRRNGYADVHKGNFGGALDYLCDKDGRVTRGGLQLMARPTQIQKLAEAHEKRATEQAVSQMKASHQLEGVNVPMPGGGDHPSALAKNRHRQTFEPFNAGKIPE